MKLNDFSKPPPLSPSRLYLIAEFGLVDLSLIYI